MKIIRQTIRVGGRVVVGAVCRRCPEWTHVVIFPVRALRTHLALHDAGPVTDVEYRYGYQRTGGRYHGGRTPGSENRTTSMLASGEERRSGMKRAY
jgi:hypothetical protein